MPLLSSHESKLEENVGEISCDISQASSSGCMDDINIHEFDTDAVDFEPLLISGTGKILNYHSESYNHGFEESISVSSSAATSIAGNVNGRQHKHTSSCLSSRFIQLLLILFLAAFMVLVGLSSFAIDANNNTNRLQTTVAKNNIIEDKVDGDIGYQSAGNNMILQEHLMNVNDAEFEASASRITFWEPYLELSGALGNEALVTQLMTIMSECFSRAIFKMQMDGTGLYKLYPIEPIPQQIRGSPNQHGSASKDIPMAVFTANFNQAAMEFDHPRGAFVTIFHDPIDIYVYLEQYTKLKEGTNGHDSNNNDNLLVRHLSGIDQENRQVNNGDYNVAKKVLKLKFVIGSCENPTQTLDRLEKLSGNSNIDSDRLNHPLDRCTYERKRWIQECRKMKEIGQQNRRSQNNQQILKDIKSKHRYDILLYKESRKLFDEQKILFE